MDEISLNVVRRHCRSPLPSGENAKPEKAGAAVSHAAPWRGNVADMDKEKVSRQAVERSGPGSVSRHYSGSFLLGQFFRHLIVPAFTPRQVVNSSGISFKRKG